MYVKLPSHIQTDLSLEQVANNEPSEFQATDFASLSCPSRVAA
jgi:hypothetical protein